MIDIDFYQKNNEFMFEHEKLINTLKTKQNILKSPVKYEINLTNKCNQHCLHCSNGENLNENEITVDMVKIIMEYEPIYVVLTGGEPLLNRNIFKIIKMLKKNNIFIKICTNGTLLNNENAIKLKESGMDSQDIIQISFDAINENDYIKIRGKNDFGKVVNNIETVKNQTKSLIELHTVANFVNIKDIYKIYEYSNELGVDVLSTSPLAYIGRAKKLQENNIIDLIYIEKKIRSKSRFYKTKYKGGLFENCQLYNLIDIESNSRNKTYKCAACNEQIYIDCDGTCYPCVYLKNPIFKLGNININFDDVISKSRKWIKNGIPIANTPCENCYLWGFCNGGCIGVAFNATNCLKPGYDNRCIK